MQIHMGQNQELIHVIILLESFYSMESFVLLCFVFSHLICEIPLVLAL